MLESAGGTVRALQGSVRRIGTTIDLGARPIGDVLEAGRAQLDELLPEYLGRQRWFAGKGSPLETARIGDVVPIPSARDAQRSVGELAMIDVTYGDGRAPERYATVLRAYAGGVDAPILDGAQLATIRTQAGEHRLADAVTDPEVVEGLLHAMRGGRELLGDGARLSGQGAGALDDALQGLGALRVEPLSLFTSNTSVRVAGRDGRQYALKLVRRHDAIAEPGTPTRALDVWKGAYLTNDAGFTNTPAVLGSVEHLGGQDGLPRTISVLTEFVPNDGDGWADALVSARRSLDLVRDGAQGTTITGSIDDYAAAARNHGRRLGELHVALSSGGAGSEFRGVLQDADAVPHRIARLREDAARTARQLRAAGRTDDAAAIEQRLGRRIAEVERATDELVPIEQIHTHGDFHLGQLLRTGDDVQIIDLEGAPALSMAERWQRRMALEDVARQRSSYEYAARQAVREASDAEPALTGRLQQVADEWARRSSDSFLTGWLDATADRRFRHARSELGPELREAEIANALYETSYELGSRPDWVSIPADRLRRLLADG